MEGAITPFARENGGLRMARTREAMLEECIERDERVHPVFEYLLFTIGDEGGLGPFWGVVSRVDQHARQ